MPDSTETVLPRKLYRAELARLQTELVKMQQWVKATGYRLAVIFEGRDAAGKGGTIKRIMDAVNPRIVQVVALPAPTDRQKTQWYFQRYSAYLPAAGEVRLFDRSWYNRAGVERVMGFCTEDQCRAFLRDCPVFEDLLIGSGLHLVKYWLTISDAEQERRFRARLDDPAKRWKLSPMDLASRSKWVEYSQARDEMFAATDRPGSPWFVVDAEVKRHARLNCLAHLLSQVPYTEVDGEPMDLPPRPAPDGYHRPPTDTLTWVPDHHLTLLRSDR